MRAKLEPLFGEIPDNVENLEIVGLFPKRFEEWTDVTVWPGSGVLRRADGSIEAETIWIEKHLEQCGDYHSKWSLFPKRQNGRYFNLSLFWWQNYYHWICDVLPRARLALARLDSSAKVLLPAGLAAWQKRSLELISLSFDRCVTYSGKRPWKVERLIYVSPLAMTGDHEPKSLIELRDVIRQNLHCVPDKPGWRKLYLTRGSAPARRVVNEKQLLPALRECGFEIVDAGSLSFEEQVKLFSEAKCIVGPHGAAFTNMLWSPPGLKVFELFEPGSVRRCYWSLCKALGHEHACGIGRPVKQGGKEADMDVPLPLMVESLKRFCS